MKPPGTTSLRQPCPGRRCSLPSTAAAASTRRLRLRLPLPSLARLCCVWTLLLFCPGCPQSWGVITANALHWNETAGNIEGTLADEDTAFQQSNSSSSKINSHNSAFQKEIILPSRLVYYLNRDSESPYHILDTRTRYQQKHNKTGQEIQSAVINQSMCGYSSSVSSGFSSKQYLPSATVTVQRGCWKYSMDQFQY